MSYQEDIEKAVAKLKIEYAATVWGKLLIKYGFQPLDTETCARNVAQKAAEEIEKLRSALLHIADSDHFPGHPAKALHDIITYAQDALL